jgi:hypothetical protein
MSQLKPGAVLIYERANGVTYAREAGADPATRVEVGWDYDPRTNDGRPLHDHIMEDRLWGEIRRTARTHEGLRQELERVIIYYQLLKEDPNTVMWHPV